MTTENVRLDQIELSPARQRKEWGNCEGLAQSILIHGVLQPVILQRKSMLGTGEQDVYEVISGNRRVKAAKIAGCFMIPAVLRDGNSSEKLILSLIENVQRENLHPLEVSATVIDLLEQTGWSGRHLSRQLGKSPEWVHYMIQLSKLSDEVQAEFRAGNISASAARNLSTLTAEQQVEMLPKVIGLSNPKSRQIILTKKAELGVRKGPRLAEWSDPVAKLRKMLCCDIPPEAMPIIEKCIADLEQHGVIIAMKQATHLKKAS